MLVRTSLSPSLDDRSNTRIAFLRDCTYHGSRCRESFEKKEHNEFFLRLHFRQSFSDSLESRESSEGRVATDFFRTALFAHPIIVSFDRHF